METSNAILARAKEARTRLYPAFRSRSRTSDSKAIGCVERHQNPLVITPVHRSSRLRDSNMFSVHSKPNGQNQTADSQISTSPGRWPQNIAYALKSRAYTRIKG